MHCPCSARSGSEWGGVDVLIPDSVLTYLHDGGIRRAVRSLIDLEEDAILDGLDWSELSRFYRAQLAARQLQAEWGLLALELWNAIWGGLLDHWQPLSLDEQMAHEEDVKLHVASLCDVEDGGLWFGRLFTKGDFTFYANLLAVPSSGLRLQFSCDSYKRSLKFPELDATKETDDDYWKARMILPLDKAEVDIAPLRDLAAAAVRIADEAILPRRRAKTEVAEDRSA